MFKKPRTATLLEWYSSHYHGMGDSWARILFFPIKSNGKRFRHIRSKNSIKKLRTNTIVSFVQVMTDKANMWLMSSTLSVDTFFAVGGLVTVYVFLKSQDKGVPFNIPLYYLHRYLRLTPVVAVLVLIYANLITYLGNGPIWHSMDDGFSVACREHWWSLLLYIQNFVNVNQQVENSINSCKTKLFFEI